ncbi:MAG: TolC family protein [Bacteroidota bacterium]
MSPLASARSALLALLALVGAQAHAQAPDTLRLGAVLDALYAENPVLAAERLDARALARRGDQVATLPDPVASVMFAPYPVLTARGTQRSQWRVEQMLPWPGTLGLRRDAADAQAEVARLGADATALDLARRATRAYADLVRTQEAAAVVRAFQARLDAFAEAAAVRYEVGRGPQGAILQVQLERQRLGERLITLDRERDAAVQTLARVLDRPGLTVEDRVVAVVPALPEADDIAALAVATRPEVSRAQAQIEAAEAQVALAEKAFYPAIGFGVVYTDVAPADAPPTATGRDALGLMASVRIPLDRASRRAGLDEARLREEAARARLAATETAVQTDVADALSDARRAAEAVALYRETLVPQAETTVESALAGYTTGALDFLAFLDAERARFSVALGLVDARARLLDAAADLARALGTTDPLLGPPAR